MQFLLLYNARPNAGSHRIKEVSGAEIIGFDQRRYVSGTFENVRWKLTASAWRARS